MYVAYATNSSYLPLCNHNMATPRKRFARSLGYNRQKKDRLNESERYAIVQDVLNGVPYKTLADRYSYHRNTIRNTFKRWKEQGNFKSRSTIGRKTRLTPRERRLLFRYIRKDPTRRWNNVLLYCQDTLSKKVSRNTIRRVFRKLKLGH